MSSGQIFVLLIITISTLGWVARSVLGGRDAGVRLGYWADRGRATDGGSSHDEAGTQRTLALLSADNERLVGQIGRLEERIAVLERIVTDPGERVARQIDALR